MMEKCRAGPASPVEVFHRHGGNENALDSIRIDEYLKRAYSHNKSHELETIKNRHGKLTSSIS